MVIVVVNGWSLGGHWVVIGRSPGLELRAAHERSSGAYEHTAYTHCVAVRSIDRRDLATHTSQATFFKVAPTSFAQTTTTLGHIVDGHISKNLRQTRHCLLQSLQVLIASVAFVDRGGLLLLAHPLAHVLPHGVVPRA